jgi:hypothetical protein
MSKGLGQLVERAFSARATAVAKDTEVVVDPAVPILYFGDLPAYRLSQLRIITVGLNPSRLEFPTADPFKRFPTVASGPGGYLPALDDYFRAAPYVGWFDAFTTLLNGLDASFGEGQPNRVLHTDIGSPIATDPTWSKLPTATKARLGAFGTPLWHDLVRELRPHVIIASVAKSWLDAVDFERLEPAWELFTHRRKNPYIVKAQRMRVSDDHAALFVWGRAGMTPFQPVTNIVRGQIGIKIKEMLL